MHGDGASRLAINAFNGSPRPLGSRSNDVDTINMRLSVYLSVRLFVVVCVCAGRQVLWWKIDVLTAREGCVMIGIEWRSEWYADVVFQLMIDVVFDFELSLVFGMENCRWLNILKVFFVDYINLIMISARVVQNIFLKWNFCSGSRKNWMRMKNYMIFFWWLCWML